MAYGYGRMVMGMVDVYTEGCAVLPLVRSTYCLSGGLEVDLMAGNAIHARESQVLCKAVSTCFCCAAGIHPACLEAAAIAGDARPALGCSVVF